MKQTNASPIYLLALVAILLLFTACDAEPAEETPEPTALATAEATGTAAAPEDEGEPEPGEIESSTNPDLTAVIVSGETAGAGKPFTFDATQSDPGALEIVNYQWNMGDGVTLFGVSVEHAYSDPGLYTVTLTVVDQEGNTDVAAQVIEIIALTEEPSLTPEGEFGLAGTAWAMDYPLRGTTLTLVFNEDVATGSAGCNTFSASYTATVSEGSPGDISMSDIAITSSNFCTAEIMYQEEGYLDSLSSARSVMVEGQKLTLETGSGTLTFSQIEVTG